VGLLELFFLILPFKFEVEGLIEGLLELLYVYNYVGDDIFFVFLV
jgi:hypothetical protein